MTSCVVRIKLNLQADPGKLDAIQIEYIRVETFVSIGRESKVYGLD